MAGLVGQDAQRRSSDWVLFGVLWVVFTVIGEAMAWGLDLLPARYAREAHVVDEAYRLLIGLAVPVFALVAAGMALVVLRFRAKPDGAPTEDGPHQTTHRVLVPVWVGVSAALAVGVSINPGFVGLRDLRGSSEADLVVQVQAQRWSWVFTYPDGVRSTTELALPVDERVRFDVTATDIVHSFWIPAFRTKIDAVPGRTTQLYVTPERTGDADRDFNVRVQCAELCGLGHTVMAAPVRVLERAEFDAWLAAQKQGA